MIASFPSIATVDDLRLEALREYLVHRTSQTHDGAIVASTFANAGYMALADNWEMCYRAIAATALLTDDSLSAERMISDLKKRKVQVQAIVDSIHEIATSAGDGQAAAQRAFLQYARQLDEMDEQVKKAAHDASLRFSETSALPNWRLRKDQILHTLHEAYSARGPQYEILCDRLAACLLLVEQLEASPITIDATEHAKMNRTVIDLTNQLQKYTEATKSEAIRGEVQDALARMLDIIETLVAPTQPALWSGIVNEIVRRAGGIVTAGGGKMLIAGMVDEKDAE